MKKFNKEDIRISLCILRDVIIWLSMGAAILGFALLVVYALVRFVYWL